MPDVTVNNVPVWTQQLIVCPASEKLSTAWTYPSKGKQRVFVHMLIKSERIIKYINIQQFLLVQAKRDAVLFHTGLWLLTNHDPGTPPPTGLPYKERPSLRQLPHKTEGPSAQPDTGEHGLSLCPVLVLCHFSISGNTYIAVSSNISKKTETCKCNFYDF